MVLHAPDLFIVTINCQFDLSNMKVNGKVATSCKIQNKKVNTVTVI